jgi:aldehyde dehydrogenase (NAD+)
MGGKNAAAVFADADLDLAAKNIVAGAFAQAGQRCTATSRLIVVKDVADELMELILRETAALTVGSGMEDGVLMGPVVSNEQRSEVFRHIETAADEHAEVVAGGAFAPSSTSEHGAFVSPTVIRVTRDQRIWHEEVFGPVLAVLEVADEDEAVAAVNDSTYGLSSAVFTNNLGAAERFVDRVDTGQVSVNQPTSGWDVHQPFGGFLDSGSPFKEQGLDALQFYTRTKTAAIRGL